ncbi:MAG: hypothetical protein HQ488_04500 [Parcubacteria group bacterium]|nr:hypothetical protein [Parcubacteria group bacterium]
MIWKTKTFSAAEAISRTGFIVSTTSYVLFWLIDLAQPGFVSRYFSVHAFLLSAIVFGVWWSAVVRDYTQRPWLESAVALALGLILAVITWGASDGIEGYRLFLTLMAVFTPTIIYVLIKD